MADWSKTMQRKQPTEGYQPGAGCAGPDGRERPKWRLEGWVRELTDREVGAVGRIAIGVRLPADLRTVDGLADECSALWPCASLPWEPERGWDPGCPGFCPLASEARWS